MSIKLKIAHTARELDDVFKLRYEVYVIEKGRFSLDSSSSENKSRIVDRFDTIPGVANIIAYDNKKPVACMRVNKDSEIGLPSEVHFDFSEARQKYTAECKKNNITPVFVSGGMLAIKSDSRNRRNIIHAMFKTAGNVMHGFGTTHILASISEETLSLYGRIGFEVIGEASWCESIGDKLIPMIAPFDKAFKWSFGDLYKSSDSIWLQGSNKYFERIILSAGEVLFFQEEIAENAYVIEEGWIGISKIDNDGNEMVLSNLSKGELFGEMAIFDHKPRSATATALTNVEVNVIPRKHLLEMIKENPEKMGQLLSYFATRLRNMHDQAMIHVFAPQNARIQFELQKLWRSALPDQKEPKVRIAKVGTKQIARSAHVSIEEVTVILEKEKEKGSLDYTSHLIRFYNAPVIDNSTIIDNKLD